MTLGGRLKTVTFRYIQYRLSTNGSLFSTDTENSCDLLSTSHPPTVDRITLRNLCQIRRVILVVARLR